jgi:hypothetical protein
MTTTACNALKPVRLERADAYKFPRRTNWVLGDAKVLPFAAGTTSADEFGEVALECDGVVPVGYSHSKMIQEAGITTRVPQGDRSKALPLTTTSRAAFGIPLDPVALKIASTRNVSELEARYGNGSHFSTKGDSRFFETFITTHNSFYRIPELGDGDVDAHGGTRRGRSTILPTIASVAMANATKSSIPSGDTAKVRLYTTTTQAEHAPPPPGAIERTMIGPRRGPPESGPVLPVGKGTFESTTASTYSAHPIDSHADREIRGSMRTGLKHIRSHFSLGDPRQRIEAGMTQFETSTSQSATAALALTAPESVAAGVSSKCDYRHNVSNPFFGTAGAISDARVSTQYQLPDIAACAPGRISSAKQRTSKLDAPNVKDVSRRNLASSLSFGDREKVACEPTTHVSTYGVPGSPGRPPLPESAHHTLSHFRIGRDSDEVVRTRFESTSSNCFTPKVPIDWLIDPAGKRTGGGPGLRIGAAENQFASSTSYSTDYAGTGRPRPLARPSSIHVSKRGKDLLSGCSLFAPTWETSSAQTGFTPASGSDESVQVYRHRNNADSVVFGESRQVHNHETTYVSAYSQCKT